MPSSRTYLSSALGLLACSSLLHTAAAQVTTSCQPLNTTNCPPDPAFGMDFNFNFNSTPNNQVWETTVGPVTYDPASGAAFTVAKQGDSPTIRTKFYYFFGRTEIWMKAAPGTGIISSMMMLSDDLDEIDWEFMGGNASYAETNYFGKGQPDFHNAIYFPVNNGVQGDYHNYTSDWTKDYLDYYIDGQKVRTLLPQDANATHLYPQTPMRLSLGIWAGGDPSLPLGTRQWAGGDTDYSKGPFTMYVKSVRITDYSNGSDYTYTDFTGSWESIQIKSGNSSTHDVITAPPTPTLADKWNSLSSNAKLAIYASAGGVGAIALIAAMYYCIRQRRRGAQEAKFAELKAEEERKEMAAFQRAGINPDSFREEATEYDAHEMVREGVVSGNSYSIPNSPTGYPGAGAGAMGPGAHNNNMSGARSPMPLLQHGPGTPRNGSPGPVENPFVDRDSHNASPVSMRSQGPQRPDLMRTASPAVNPQARSFSSPNAQMRLGSPGPARGGYGDVQRMGSPGPMAAPQPQRSFTSGGYGSQPGAGYGPQPGAGYANNNNNNRGGQDQGYWGGNNNYR